MAKIPCGYGETVITPTTQPTNKTGGTGGIYLYKYGKVVQLSIQGIFKNIGHSYTSVADLPSAFLPQVALYYEGCSYFTQVGTTPTMIKYMIYIGGGEMKIAISFPNGTDPGTNDISVYNNITYITQ